jgi:hypothetical protein
VSDALRRLSLFVLLLGFLTLVLGQNVSAQQYETTSCNDPDNCDFNINTDSGKLLLVGHTSADTGNNCDYTFKMNLDGDNVATSKEGDSDWSLYDNQAIVTLRDVNSGNHQINTKESHECSPNWKSTQVTAIQVSNSWGAAKTARCNDADGCDFNIDTGSGKLLVLGYSSAHSGNNDDWTFNVDVDGTTEASVKEGDSDTTVHDNQYFSTLVDVNSGSHSIDTWETRENIYNWIETQVVAIEIPSGVSSSSVECNNPDNCDFSLDTGSSPVFLTGHTSSSTHNDRDHTFNFEVDGTTVASAKEGNSDWHEYVTQGLATTVDGGNLNINTWKTQEGSPNWKETQVLAVAINDPDSPSITNINFNRIAGNPATIEGDLDVNVDTDGAPNNELESCTVNAEGQDSGGQVSLSTNINGDSCSFSVDNNDHGNWNPDEEIKFDISVQDSYSGTDSLPGQFKQFPVNPPNSPDSPQPTDEEDTVSTGHDLSVTATHPDGLDMDVRFYLDDGSGFTQVGPTRDASDGDTVSVSPPLDPGTPYTWKASATTQGRTEESSEWTFTTNYRPSVESMTVEDLDSGHAVSFSSVVSDQDGRNQIDGCDLVVSDGEGDTANPVVSMSAGDSPDEAVCSVDRIDFQDSDWTHLEELDFELTVTDDQGLSDSDTNDTELPNHRPVIQSLRTEDYPDRQAFRITSLIGAVDFNKSELRSCNLVIDDGENSYSAGNMVEVNSTHVRCIQENIGSGQFSTLTVDEEIEIRLRATDIHGATSSDDIAFNVPTGIDYRYSSLIISAGGVDFLPFQVSNSQQVETQYRVELQNVNASFTSNGETSKTFTLSGRSAETLRIRLSPDVGFTGTKDLKIVTENLETDINRTHEIPVRVIETGSSSRKPVPGPGLVQIVILFLAATVFFVKAFP